MKFLMRRRGEGEEVSFFIFLYTSGSHDDWMDSRRRRRNSFRSALSAEEKESCCVRIGFDNFISLRHWVCKGRDKRARRYEGDGRSDARWRESECALLRFSSNPKCARSGGSRVASSTRLPAYSPLNILPELTHTKKNILLQTPPGPSFKERCVCFVFRFFSWAKEMTDLYPSAKPRHHLSDAHCVISSSPTADDGGLRGDGSISDLGTSTSSWGWWMSFVVSEHRVAAKGGEKKKRRPTPREIIDAFVE